MKTNFFYRVLVPDLLDTLEGVERARLELVRRVLGRCVETERDVTVIVTKCHADMGAAVASMDVESDINLIVDINKSGKLQFIIFSTRIHDLIT